MLAPFALCLRGVTSNGVHLFVQTAWSSKTWDQVFENGEKASVGSERVLLLLHCWSDPSPISPWRRGFQDTAINCLCGHRSVFF